MHTSDTQEAPRSGSFSAGLIRETLGKPLQEERYCYVRYSALELECSLSDAHVTNDKEYSRTETYLKASIVLTKKVYLPARKTCN